MKKLNSLFAICLLALICFAAPSRVPAQQETAMTNEEIVSLAGAGLNAIVIVNKIRTSKSNFDVSTDALIRLKKAGVGDDVINAMLEAKSGKPVTPLVDPDDPMSPKDYGIYLYEETDGGGGGGGRKMTRLEPNVSVQNRSVGKFTARLVPFGFGIQKIKAELDGVAAALQLRRPRPVFYFYLDAKSGGLNTASGIPSATTEFVLVRFSIHDKKRQITVSRRNAYKEKGGLMDESIVDFTTEDLGGGIFRVTPSADLRSGEYAFYLINSGTTNTGPALGAKFFDFGVKLL